ncbi:hypothetical protein P9112_000236 [Eukaryota sp. TZLM1-RC]
MSTILVKLPSGKSVEYPIYTTGLTILKDLNPETSSIDDVAVVLINGQIYSLNDPIDINCTFKPVAFNTSIGCDVYRRSLCYAVAMVASELWPTRRLIISHSIGHGLYYYFDGVETTNDDIVALNTRLQKLSKDALPIYRKTLAYEEAVEHFKQAGLSQTVLLLEHKNEPRVYVSTCGNYFDLWYAPLVQNTSALSVFSIEKYQEGLLIRYPDSKDPSSLPPFVDNPVLYKVYKEHNQWGACLDVNCVGDLNHLIFKGNIKDFIMVSEALHDGKTAAIADKVPSSCKLVCICGPSSSGKTTFCRKLSIALRARGWKPISISLDDYYVNRVDTPLDEDGNWDFEVVDALDLKLLNNDLVELFKGKTIRLPKFNFKTGIREEGGLLTLPEKGVLIIEGIHGLNPRLTEKVPDDVKFKIFISPLTQLNIDDHNRISTSDNRLIRRMVRDKQFRVIPLKKPLKCFREYQGDADAVFNSALDYEISVLKVLAVPLLQQIKPSSIYYSEARRLLDFLSHFDAIMNDDVPSNSLIREFIGGGCFNVH